MEVLIKFLSDSKVIDYVISFLVLFAPILLVIFFRPGWLMIFPGAACSGYGLYLDSYFNCYRYDLVDHYSCSDEILTEISGLWPVLFIGGLIYSTVIFVIVHVVWPRIQPRKR
jgi:hypothetical protein